MSGKTNGPHLTIAASCIGCAHETSEGYKVQGDSGFNVRCTHPDAARASGDARGRIGDTTWSTPSWCPRYTAALEALVMSMKADAS